MAVLVHITNANNEKSISQSGIKQGKWDNIVYFMPHMEEFLISHQWARAKLGSDESFYNQIEVERD